jgi:hypothetical protein
MKRNKLHKWSAVIFIFTVFSAGCSQKDFPSNSGTAEEKYETSVVAGGSNNSYQPPQVIIISDEKAKSNKEGELYFDDEYGYRYWKYSDGKYYLDQKYERGASPKKKTVNRKKPRKIASPADFVSTS